MVRRITSRTMLALLIFVSVVPLLAQEIPRIPETPREEIPESSRQKDRESSPAERENEQFRRTIKDGNELHLSIPAVEDLLRENYLRNHPNDRPFHLEWKETRGASGNPTWIVSSPKGELNLIGVEQLLREGQTIVSSGRAPSDQSLRRAWRVLRDKYPDQIIVHEPESANRSEPELSKAAFLGTRPLNPASVRIFNALPMEHADILRFFSEQNRMGIGGTPEFWRNLNEDIQKRSAGFRDTRVATKQEVLEEFRSGTSSTMILYAHFSDGHLYMPGAHGGSISIDEIKQIVRNDPGAKNRVIILAACSTGARTADTRSLTSVLLENGIAGAVMATDRPYDARLIPGLIERLKSGVPLRRAGGLGEPGSQGQPGVHLQQYVEVVSYSVGFEPATGGKS